ncbi:DUF3240 family protein [Sphingomonas sp. CL5.1]|uniref:DUF3240 family protein n=1 Tax=Sphingomonas sp. CL5.1 TaxID=2653203 RepID=UPI001583A981|nr:DUF3240 family protein [Sphingomonas sp. CL5.1]QKR99002.1 DUF3240 family protein [Sphingomonas sp. CL5.1]
MAELLLTFHCAASDAAPIAEALHAAGEGPVHVRAEAVLGRDFSDATTAERVTGRLDRRAVELIVAESRLAMLVAVVETLRRGGPVRWYATPVIARGRLA